MRPLEQALYCIARDYSVIAGYPPGKSERAIIKGTADGTTDKQLIEKWFTEIPDRNIMISLRNSGLICIDLDQHQAGQNGALLFNQIWQDNAKGELLNTYIEQTPTGSGLHIFFKVPQSAFEKPIKSLLADGIEIKTHFTPIYPSKRTDGEYRPLNHRDTGQPLTLDDVSDCPDWLLEMIHRPEQARATTLVTRTYGAEMWELFVSGASKGKRNNETNKLLHYWRKIGIEPSVCMELLQTFNHKTNPPLPDKELATIWKSVFKMN